MKIEIEIPDWANERHIYVMAGIELAAYKLAHENEFHVKTGRCSACGACCMGMRSGSREFPTDEKGTCINLINDGPTKKVCKLGVARPFSCNLYRNEAKPREGCTQVFALQFLME